MTPEIRSLIAAATEDGVLDAELLVTSTIEACCQCMEHRDSDRIVPRPSWQLYQRFGLDWRPHWHVESGVWRRR